jgi:hypothetical protein
MKLQGLLAGTEHNARTASLFDNIDLLEKISLSKKMPDKIRAQANAPGRVRTLTTISAEKQCKTLEQREKEIEKDSWGRTSSTIRCFEVADAHFFFQGVALVSNRGRSCGAGST